ncbi:MAG TPA: glycosyltransferase family 39 protein, partial [Polyangia bacterium]
QSAPWTFAGLSQAFTFLDRSSIATWNLPPAPPYAYFRPLVVASFKLDLLLGGGAPLPFHVTNLLLHLAAVALVAALALRLTGDGRLARVAALLFGLQPQNAVAVVWASGRTELMATALVLGALLATVVARQERRPRWLLLAIALQALACLAKESAVLLPACVAACELARWIARPDERRLRAAVGWVAPSALVAGAFLVYRFAVFDPGGALGPPYFESPARLAAFLPFAGTKVLYGLFALLTTAPVVPVFGVELLRAHPAALVACVLVTAGLGALALRGRWRHPAVVAGLAWLAASFLPTLPLPSIDLYLYFGSIGLALALAPALARAPRWLLAAVLVLYAGGTLARGLFYHQEGVVNRRVHDEIVADGGGRLPPGTTLYLVNMPFTAAHVAPMARVLTGNPAIRAMLVTLSDEWATPTRPVEVECLGPQAVRVRPPAGRRALLDTKEEWHLHLFRRPLDTGAVYRADGVAVTPVVDGGRVVALDLRFDRPLAAGLDRVYSFHDDGRRLAHRRCGAAAP